MNSNENLIVENEPIIDNLILDMKNNPDHEYCLIYKGADFCSDYFSLTLRSLGGVDFLSKTKFYGTGFFWAPYFVLIDSEGNLLLRNNDFMEVVKDSNDYVHVSEKEEEKYLIKLNPVTDKTEDKSKHIHYLGGKSFEYINKCILEFMRRGLLEKPNDFGDNGFNKKPIPTNKSSETLETQIQPS